MAKNSQKFLDKAYRMGWRNGFEDGTPDSNPFPVYPGHMSTAFHDKWNKGHCDGALTKLEQEDKDVQS